MSQERSPAAVFALTHRWFVASIALLILGLIGVSAVAWLVPQPLVTADSRLQSSSLPAKTALQATPTLEQTLISVASGVSLFFAVVSLVMWFYGLAKNRSLMPQMNSVTIKELASKKLITVLVLATGIGFLLYWSLLIILMATPFTALAATDFAPFALLLTVIAVGSVAALFFLAQGRLLISWLPCILCPKCQEQITLINYWQCVGGCTARKMRHALSPCPTCGTKNQGLACANHYCGEALGFDSFYNEFEVANRTRKYVTHYNPLFWGALTGLELSLILLYVCFQADILILWLLFGLLALGLAITLIVAKPKRLISNRHYVEGEQRWTKRATA